LTRYRWRRQVMTWMCFAYINLTSVYEGLSYAALV
jgi:hypothetical protein